MSKGSSKAAAKQVGVDNQYATDYNKSAQSTRASLFPFLDQEIKNPQGFGQPAINQMTTLGGQSVSGSTGAADEAGRLNASRTGNTASLPALIAANGRSAMKQQSDNTLNIGLQNELLKEKQRQAGAEGEQGLYGTDTGSSLKALGLADDSINAWTGAKKAANDNILGTVGTIGSLGLGGGKLWEDR